MAQPDFLARNGKSEVLVFRIHLQYSHEGLEGLVGVYAPVQTPESSVKSVLTAN